MTDTRPPIEEGASAAELIDAEAFTNLSATARERSDARVAVVEFSDFQCPYCGVFSRDTYTSIQDDFVRTGKIRYVFRHFPLNQIHPFAGKLAEAVECAGEQEKFWQMREWLFSHQRALTAPALPEHAAAVGLDVARFSSCLNGSIKAQIVRADEAEGARLGINSTPTFLVGAIQSDGRIKVLRRIKGAQPYDVFKSVIEASLRGIAP